MNSHWLTARIRDAAKDLDPYDVIEAKISSAFERLADTIDAESRAIDEARGLRPASLTRLPVVEGVIYPAGSQEFVNDQPTGFANVPTKDLVWGVLFVESETYREFINDWVARKFVADHPEPSAVKLVAHTPASPWVEVE